MANRTQNSSVSLTLFLTFEPIKETSGVILRYRTESGISELEKVVFLVEKDFFF